MSMKITYSNLVKKKLKDVGTIQRCYGVLARPIRVVLSMLDAAPNLEMVPSVPPTLRHKLTGDYKGCWGITLKENWRMVIQPLVGVEPSDITEVIVLDVVDYHGN